MAPPTSARSERATTSGCRRSTSSITKRTGVLATQRTPLAPARQELGPRVSPLSVSMWTPAPETDSTVTAGMARSAASSGSSTTMRSASGSS